VARNHHLIAALALIVAGASGGAAFGQTLPRLHVHSMTMSANPGRVRLGEVARLVLGVHVDERIPRLDNVTLPDLSGFDVLGDERRCVAARRGTDCMETLSIAPTVSGVRTIGPFWLDAVDARDGKAKRFGSNPVTVTVAEPSALAPNGGLAHLAADLARAVAIVALLVVALVALFLGFRRSRRRGSVVPTNPSAPLPLPPEVDEEARYRAMIERLRAQPSRSRVLAVRRRLRRRVGAQSDETFTDLTTRGVQLEDPSAMEALRLIERAAFVGDAHLVAAVHDALPALDAL
jgi:hypothetical protein